jgi:hypothetical protein
LPSAVDGFGASTVAAAGKADETDIFLWFSGVAATRDTKKLGAFSLLSSHRAAGEKSEKQTVGSLTFFDVGGANSAGAFPRSSTHPRWWRADLVLS